MIRCGSCTACELTLEEICVQQIPVELCGLCRLMAPGVVQAYVDRWGKRWVNEIGDGVRREVED